MAGQPGRVVIVGAGPAGMALAYLLARRGVGVTVLETHHDFARVFRGEGLQRSGIDAFRQMGLGEHGPIAVPDGLSTRKVPTKGFRSASVHLILLSQASWRNRIDRRCEPASSGGPLRVGSTPGMQRRASS